MAKVGIESIIFLVLARFPYQKTKLIGVLCTLSPLHARLDVTPDRYVCISAKQDSLEPEDAESGALILP